MRSNIILVRVEHISAIITVSLHILTHLANTGDFKYRLYV